MTEVWNKIANYRLNDNVIYEGNTYVCIFDNVNIPPPSGLGTYWITANVMLFPPTFAKVSYLSSFTLIPSGIQYDFAINPGSTSQEYLNMSPQLNPSGDLSGVKIDFAGTYLINVVANAQKVSAGFTGCYLWLTNQGNPLPFSSSFVELTSGDATTQCITYIGTFNPNDYIGISCAPDASDMEYSYQGSIPGTSPIIPSITLTIERVE